MAETNTRVQTASDAGHVQSELQPEVRNEPTFHATPVNEGATNVNVPTLESLQLERDREKERERSASIEAGRRYLSRYSSSLAVSDEHAEIISGFDESNYEPQPAEFFAVRSTELDRFGYL